jgi:hypothetical protein
MLAAGDQVARGACHNVSQLDNTMMQYKSIVHSLTVLCVCVHSNHLHAMGAFQPFACCGCIIYNAVVDTCIAMV